MYPILSLMLVVGTVLTTWLVRRNRAAKRERRWKPDIHRVT
jgi:hypothetical protein